MENVRKKCTRHFLKKVVIADEPYDAEQIVAVDIVAELPNQNIVRVPTHRETPERPIVSDLVATYTDHQPVHDESTVDSISPSQEVVTLEDNCEDDDRDADYGVEDPAD